MGLLKIISQGLVYSEKVLRALSISKRLARIGKSVKHFMQNQDKYAKAKLFPATYLYIRNWNIRIAANVNSKPIKKILIYERSYRLF